MGQGAPCLQRTLGSLVEGTVDVMLLPLPKERKEKAVCCWHQFLLGCPIFGRGGYFFRPTGVQLRPLLAQLQTDLECLQAMFQLHDTDLLRKRFNLQSPSQLSLVGLVSPFGVEA